MTNETLIHPESLSDEQLDFMKILRQQLLPGLSGTLDEVARVAQSHYVIFEKLPLEDSDLGYTMDHSSIIYVVGKDGVIKSLNHHGESPGGIAEAWREALAG